MRETASIRVHGKFSIDSVEQFRQQVYQKSNNRVDTRIDSLKMLPKEIWSTVSCGGTVPMITGCISGSLNPASLAAARQQGRRMTLAELAAWASN